MIIIIRIMIIMIKMIKIHVNWNGMYLKRWNTIVVTDKFWLYWMNVIILSFTHELNLKIKSFLLKIYRKRKKMKESKQIKTKFFQVEIFPYFSFLSLPSLVMDNNTIKKIYIKTQNKRQKAVFFLFYSNFDQHHENLYQQKNKRQIQLLLIAIVYF